MKKKWRGRQTGVMTVRSGRWLPPAQGWLLRTTSPSFKLFTNDLICAEKPKYTPREIRRFNLPCQTTATPLTWYCTVSCIAPRWTGMCGALETKPPSGPNTAQEKSRRSLMLVEMEVLWRTRPICSVNAGRQMRASGTTPPIRRRRASVLTPSTAGRVPAMLMKR